MSARKVAWWCCCVGLLCSSWITFSVSSWRAPSSLFLAASDTYALWLSFYELHGIALERHTYFAASARTPTTTHAACTRSSAAVLPFFSAAFLAPPGAVTNAICHLHPLLESLRLRSEHAWTELGKVRTLQQ